MLVPIEGSGLYLAGNEAVVRNKGGEEKQTNVFNLIDTLLN